MVQVRVTVSPATMEDEEGEETRDMLAGSVYKGQNIVEFSSLIIGDTF